MYCVHCGASNSDTDEFCRSCGQSLGGPSRAKVANAAGRQMNGVQGENGQDVASGYVAPAQQQGARGYGQTPGYQQGYAQGYQQPGYQAYGGYQGAYQPEGVLSAAWRDITSTPGWLKKLPLLCLLGCVPILDLGVEGYALRWSRELMLGERNVMPQEVFKKKEIITGFRALLIELVMYSVLIVVAGLFGMLMGAFASLFGYQAAIGMVGLVEVVTSLFAFFLFYPFVNAAIMRMVTVDYLEGGLNVKKILAAFRRNMGGVIGASIVPDLVVGLVQGVLIGICVAIVVIAENGFYPSYFFYGAISGFEPGLFLALFFIILIFIVIAMLSVFATLLRWRAVGHWASRTAPEWKNETDEETYANYAQSGRKDATQN